jgi:hypothetical protein
VSLALTEALALSDDNDDSACEVDEADVNPSVALPLAAPLAGDSCAERNASVSCANWLHALSELADGDALVEVEVNAVDVADAVDVSPISLVRSLPARGTRRRRRSSQRERVGRAEGPDLADWMPRRCPPRKRGASAPGPRVWAQ